MADNMKDKVTIKSKKELDPTRQAFNAVMERLRQTKTELLFLDAAMLLLGIVMIAIPAEFNHLIGWILGAVLCIWGVMRCITFLRLKNEEIFGSYALVQGAAMLAFGIFFLCQPERFANLLNAALILIVLVIAVLQLQNAINFYKLGIGKWWLHLIMAVIVLTFGIIALIKPEFVEDENALLLLMTRLIGIAFVLGGIWDIISVLILSKAVRTKAQEWDEQGLLSTEGLEKARAKAKEKADNVIHVEVEEETDA